MEEDMVDGPKLVQPADPSNGKRSMKERLRDGIRRISELALQKATQASVLLIPLFVAVLLRVQYELAHETTAIVVFVVYFAARVSISQQNFYDAAFSALLVACGAIILLPALYGSGVGIVATRGFEKLFLTIVGFACMVLGAFVFTDDRK